MEFKRHILGEWVEHDEIACKALHEYDLNADYVKSPIAYMKQISYRYNVPIEEMKKHWDCIYKNKRKGGVQR